MRTLPVFRQSKWVQSLGYALLIVLVFFPDALICQSPLGGNRPVFDAEQQASAERVRAFLLEPIRYEIGPPVGEGVHAYLSFDVEGGESVQFLNAQLVGNGAPEGQWVLRNVPLLPHGNKQRISCTVNMEEMGGVGEGYNLAYHVGDEPVSGMAFPPIGGMTGLAPETAVHRVYSGSDDPPVAIELPAPGASTLLIFPRIPKIEYVYRGCDVPNIDLNLKDCDEAETGIPCDTLACGPASAANSLHWLKDQHDELAGDTTSLRYKTDRLKQLMKMNKHGVKGVRFDSMVIGKLTLIDELKLPIHVKYNTLHESGNEKELVSDNPDYDHKADNEGKMGVHPMFDWLKKEMEAGEDVEVQIGWYGPLEKGEDGKMKRKRHYGHWLVASGYFQMGDLKGMFLKDDDDQLDTGGLRHKYYPWDTLPGGVPYLKALTDARGNVAIVESFVSESYDPTVEFKDPVSIRPSPWDELDLFHERMKPGYPFAMMKDRRGFPWWPVIGGTVGGGALAYFLTRDPKDEEDDPVCALYVRSQVTHATCGRSNGAIAVTTQGAEDVTFQWSDGQSDSIRSGLSAGMYSVAIRWNEGKCMRREEWTVEDERVEFMLRTMRWKQPDCGSENGEIVVKALPEGNYQFFWSNGVEGPALSGVAAGTYEVTAMLGENCTESVTFDLYNKLSDFYMTVVSSSAYCTGGGSLLVFITNTGNSDSLVLILEGNGISEEFMLTAGTYSLEEWVTIFPGWYTLTLYDPEVGKECSVIEKELVHNGTPWLSTTDDYYKTPFETPLSDNVLDNDRGYEIRLLSVDSVIGGMVTYSEDGAFTFTPEDGFSGRACFYYTIIDRCDSLDFAKARIEVLPKGCDFAVQFSSVSASCGWNDGSIHARVIEPGQYSYVWEDGTTGQLLEGVQRGEYTVNVTDLSLGCVLPFTGTVGEQPARYFQRLHVLQPECPDPGDIRFEAITPGPGPILMEVIHPAGHEFFEIQPGLTFLSDYIPITEGEYKVILSDEGIGPACRSEFTVMMKAMEVVQIELEGVIPASGPTSMDGAIIAFISDPGQAPHSIYLNGSFYGMTGTIEVFIEGVGVGQHSVYVVDANGCVSNVLNVTVPFQESQWSLGVGIGNQSGPMQKIEHPITSSKPTGQLHYEIMIRKRLFQSPIFVQGGIMGDRNGVYPNINLFGEWPVHTSKFWGLKCRSGIQGWYHMGSDLSERYSAALSIAPLATWKIWNTSSIEMSFPFSYNLVPHESRLWTIGCRLMYRIGINPHRSINTGIIERHFQSIVN
jgi:hypothetical protein